MNDFVLLYCPYPEYALAEKAARSLVQSGLCACAQILPSVRSFYVWEGETVDAAETPLLLKCRKETADEVALRLEREHPYECCCVLRISATANLAYAAWAKNER